jgi:hypothetical protein
MSLPASNEQIIIDWTKDPSSGSDELTLEIVVMEFIKKPF